MSETTFDGLLQVQSPALHGCLEEMRRRAQDDWVHLLKPDHGSHSGLIHLRNVERCANKIVPEKLKADFSAGEVFLLLASCLLHDLGRIIPDRPRREVILKWAGTKGPDFGEFSWQKQRLKQETAVAESLSAALAAAAAPALKGGMPVWEGSTECRLVETSAEWCLLEPQARTECRVGNRSLGEQKTHACRTKYLVDNYWTRFGLPDEQLAALCGVVCFCHQLDRPPARARDGCVGLAQSAARFEDTSVDPYGRIRVPLLAAVLRLADETEDSWTRAIRQYWYEQFLRVGGTADLYKAFRRGVADVEFVPEVGCIIMHVEPSGTGELDKTLVERLEKKVHDTRVALSGWRQTLGRYGIRYNQVYVQQKRRLSLVPLDPESPPTPLADVLGLPVPDTRRASDSTPAESEPLQAPLIDHHKVSAYCDKIRRLVSGTFGYGIYRWSAIEAAIGERLDEKAKWVIERIGDAEAETGLRIHSDRKSGDVHIESVDAQPDAGEPSSAVL
jgi:hypothetical protein